MKKQTYFAAGAALLIGGCATARTERVYIGTSKSKGIYVADFDAETGALSAPRLAVETKNCGFVALHPNHKFLYSTGTSAFEINPDGTLAELNTQATQGGAACHVNVDPTGRCAMVAYYGGGAVASFKILADGSLSPAASYFEHEGSGEHPERQDKPHAHSVFLNPANTHAYAPDLGIDKIMIYQLDAPNGALLPAGEAVVPGGSMGPRHMKWNAAGTIAYVLNELDLSVSVFKAIEDGQLEFIKTVSVLPEGADAADMSCAEIRVHPNGKFVYTSIRDLKNKGRDGISVFTRFEDGFELLAAAPAEVWIPRNFNLDPSGKWMLVGGMRSNDIALFKVDPDSGLIEFTGDKIPFDGGPICFEFLD